MFDTIAFIALAAAEEAAHGAERAPTPLFADTSTWVSLGFLVVVALFLWKGVHKQIAQALDKRGQAIADELNRARALKDEANELLAQYQRRAREAEDEAAGLIEQARRDAARMGEEARAKIDDQIARRLKAAEEKIARAEAQALAEVRAQTADVAVEAARDIIRQRMDQGAHAALADKAIGELRAKMR